jgi:cob(I)alamin adenosyltransferase
MSNILKKGCIQVYTGNGKGKSTAAFGLAMRMAGNGGRVYIARFMKGRRSGEYAALEHFNDSLPGCLDYEDFGSGKFVFGAPSTEDIELARAGLERVRKAFSSGEYDLVILDEINNALYFGLLTEDELMTALSTRAGHTELVLTGRNAPQRVVDAADLVTEMREHKHYFNAGIPARRGIED